MVDATDDSGYIGGELVGAEGTDNNTGDGTFSSFKTYTVNKQCAVPQSCNYLHCISLGQHVAHAYRFTVPRRSRVGNVLPSCYLLLLHLTSFLDIQLRKPSKILYNSDNAMSFPAP